MSFELADPSVLDETTTNQLAPEPSAPKRRARSKEGAVTAQETPVGLHSSPEPTDATREHSHQVQGESPVDAGTAVIAAGQTSVATEPPPEHFATNAQEPQKSALSPEEKQARRMQQRQDRAAQSALRIKGIAAAKERAIHGRELLAKKLENAQGVVHEESLELWTPQLFTLCSRELAFALSNINTVTVGGATRLANDESQERIDELKTTVNRFLDFSKERAEKVLGDYVLVTRDGKYQVSGKPVGRFVVPVTSRVVHDMIEAIQNLDRSMQYAKSLSIVGPAVGESKIVYVDAPAASSRAKSGDSPENHETPNRGGHPSSAQDGQTKKVQRKIQGVDYDVAVEDAKKQLRRFFGSIADKARLVIRGLREGQAAVAPQDPHPMNETALDTSDTSGVILSTTDTQASDSLAAAA